MRRKEFDLTENRQETEAFLKEMTYGFLGTIRPDGWPSVIPLNYVYYLDAVYFHGSKIGEKMSAIATEPRVTFTVSQQFAIIPSYATDPELACPASTYFKSVVIRGYARIVEDLEEKAAALEAFMRKLQPEGGYKKIRADVPAYVQRLKGVAVVRIDIESLTAKFKFGQNLTEDKRTSVLSLLADRNLPLDEETARLMRKYCPHAGGYPGDNAWDRQAGNRT
jgi:hypothetical protein